MGGGENFRHVAKGGSMNSRRVAKGGMHVKILMPVGQYTPLTKIIGKNANIYKPYKHKFQTYKNFALEHS